MFKTIALTVIVLLAVAIAGILLLAATKPDTFRVQRAMTIKAPPERIFALINDFRKWDGWSPWEKKDPEMKRSFSGAASGEGAVYAWDGDKNVGKGRMEITEATPPSKVVLKLDFEKPFEAHNTVVFTLEVQGDSTNVTWDMQGPTPFFAKIIHVFMDMDKMLGKDFEAGLASMRRLAER